ncbi:hypothetical protein [uncultured Bacteroides sp.]|uniref:hypothetical protein n=1 Tax=uncultured Bacteroides sp. TaxID=162156 RepID=UPI002610B4F5|nr:hypothetical protein [uncultured Bacteroides sp.]
MKNISIAIAIICGLLCVNTQNQVNDNYYCLKGLVENYYYHYYKYPNSVSEIIQFTEYCLTVDTNYFPSPEKKIIQSEILPRLNNLNIQIVNNDNFGILQNNDTLFCFKKYLFSPCEINLFIGDSAQEYYAFYNRFSKPRFFDKAGFAIILSEKAIDFENDLIKSTEQQIGINSISFRYYMNEKDTIPVFLFLEYEFGKGLRDFCDKKKKLNTSYYQQLDSLCNEFCINNKIARIIFPSFDYQ